MTQHPLDRPPPKPAGPDLLVLTFWEEATARLFQATNRWPKSARFTVTQRLQDHALDVTGLLVSARYEPSGRTAALRECNLTLEKMRFLLRLARNAGIDGNRSFERLVGDLDEVGRMLHGWRVSLGERKRRTA